MERRQVTNLDRVGRADRQFAETTVLSERRQHCHIDAQLSQAGFDCNLPDTCAAHKNIIGIANQRSGDLASLGSSRTNRKISTFFLLPIQRAQPRKRVDRKCFDVKLLNLQGERLADIILTEPEFARETHPLVDTRALSPSVTVRGLRYRYVEQEPYVLDGIDLEIPAGSSVAIAGPSGCGKTTLVNSLRSIVPVTEGDILIGGIPLSQFGVDQLRFILPRDRARSLSASTSSIDL